MPNARLLKLTELIKKNTDEKTGELKLSRSDTEDIFRWVFAIEAGMRQQSDLINNLKKLLHGAQA